MRHKHIMFYDANQAHAAPATRQSHAQTESYLLRTGRGAAALRRPLLHPCSLPLLQHAGVQPFLDEPHDASVRDAVLDELHEPSVVDGIEESTDVDVEHPVHL